MKRVAVILGLGLASGCSSSATDLSVQITLGYETGAMTEAPAVSELRVDALNGGAVAASSQAAPGGGLDFGQLDQGITIELDATGTDAKGTTVMLGRSLDDIVVGGQGLAPLFVQRTGTWSRPPGTIANGHISGVAAAFLDHDLLLTGGTATNGGDSAVNGQNVELYDLATLSQDSGGSFPFPCRSIVMQGTIGLLIGDDPYGANTIDFVNNPNPAEVPLPAGLTSFGEVAGGISITAPSGTVYVVGATRASPATDAVLAVDINENVTAVHLTTPRAGAAAAYIPNVGLVVAGGSATGLGAEVLADSGTSFGTLALAPDPTIGAALATLGGTQALLIGGTLGGKGAPTRSFDAACPSNCPIKPLPLAALPTSLSQTWAFTMAPNRFIVGGSEVDEMHLDQTFIVDLGQTTAQTTVVSVPLREPRSGAMPVPAQNGTLALMGGVHPDGTPALTIETFFPQ